MNLRGELWYLRGDLWYLHGDLWYLRGDLWYMYNIFFSGLIVLLEMIGWLQILLDNILRL